MIECIYQLKDNCIKIAYNLLFVIISWMQTSHELKHTCFILCHFSIINLILNTYQHICHLYKLILGHKASWNIYLQSTRYIIDETIYREILQSGISIMFHGLIILGNYVNDTFRNGLFVYMYQNYNSLHFLKIVWWYVWTDNVIAVFNKVWSLKIYRIIVCFHSYNYVL